MKVVYLALNWKQRFVVRLYILYVHVSTRRYALASLDTSKDVHLILTHLDATAPFSCCFSAQHFLLGDIVSTWWS